jgi:hypothetical protein
VACLPIRVRSGVVRRSIARARAPAHRPPGAGEAHSWVPGLEGVVDISGDLGTFCPLLGTGRVKCWGRGDFGERDIRVRGPEDRGPSCAGAETTKMPSAGAAASAGPIGTPVSGRQAIKALEAMGCVRRQMGAGGITSLSLRVNVIRG